MWHWFYNKQPEDATPLTCGAIHRILVRDQEDDDGLASGRMPLRIWYYVRMNLNHRESDFAHSTCDSGYCSLTSTMYGACYL